MAKYTDARYPEKVNDIIDNDGKIKAEALPVDPEPTVVNDYEGLVDFINELVEHYEEKLDVDQTFYFKDANPVDIERTLTSFDYEAIAYVTGMEEPTYDFCFNLVGNVTGEDFNSTAHASNYDHLSGYIPVQIQLKFDSDTETGGYIVHVYFGRPLTTVTGGLVSGTLRIKTIGENAGE